MKRINNTKQASRKIYEARINKVLAYINDNLSEKLTLDKLAEVSCFSPYHFHRIFHAYLNETPGDFVNRLRIEKAGSCLVVYPDEPVTDILFKCGFDSPSSFARSFKNHFGVSASEFREQFLKDSKNCKPESKNSKEPPSAVSYFWSVSKTTLQNNIDEEEEMKSEIKVMPKIHAACLTHYEGYNSKIGKLYEKLCMWAGPKGLINKETIFFGVSLDNPDITPEDKCRYNACISVPEHITDDPEVMITDIPEAKCVTAYFEGKQEEIPGAYDNLFKSVLPANGLQPDDMPAYEIYLSDPNETPEKLFKMQICIPVKSL